MQVSQVSDHVTHAVIGGHQAIDMGISDSPEFFSILSSTLYTDQKLAVVRETICNAWDAHIEAGKQDVPIEITLTSDMLIIRDYGLGIHHADIGPIYGVYGNSTKKNDGKQTGGFGLGCKSPFAYVDNFQVTSMNAGTKTIYSINKSSAEVNGKPAITPVAAVPTDETGLEVMIEIKQEHYDQFLQRICKVVFFGDIKANLNGEPLETVELGTNEHDFKLMLNPQHDMENDQIYIRYGNVIYPIPSTVSTDQVERLWAKANSYRYSSNRYRKIALIIQAAPHSISVTPSRESLSMQEKTKATLDKLLDTFLINAQKNFATNSQIFVRQNIKDVLKGDDPDRALQWPSGYIATPDFDAANLRSINNYDDLTKFRLSFDFPLLTNKQAIDLLKIAFKHQRETFPDPNKIDRLVAKEFDGSQEFTDYLIKEQVMKPLVRLFNNAKLDVNRLVVIDRQRKYKEYSSYKKKQDRDISVPLGQVLISDFRDTPAKLALILKLMRSRITVGSSVNVLRTNHCSNDLGYLLPRKQAVREEQMVYAALAPQRKFDIVEPEVVVRAKPGTKVKTKTPAKNGFIRIDSMINSAGKIDMQRYFGDYTGNFERLEKPEWYFLNYSKKASEFPRWILEQSELASIWLMNKAGDKGVVINSKVHEQKLVEAGVKPAEVYFSNLFIEELKKHPEINFPFQLKYHSKNDSLETMFNTLVHNKKLIEIFRRMLNYPQYRTFADISLDLSADGQKLIEIWEERMYVSRYIRSDEEQTYTRAILKIPPCGKVIDALNRLHKQPWLSLVNHERLVKYLFSEEEMAELLKHFL